jgi:hypothetical protein
MKNLRVFEVTAKIRTQNLPHTSQKLYPFSQPTQQSLHKNHCVSEMDSISDFNSYTARTPGRATVIPWNRTTIWRLLSLWDLTSVMWSGRQLPTLQRDLLPPFSSPLATPTPLHVPISSASFSCALHFYTIIDGCSRFLRNVGNLLQDVICRK